MNTTTTTNKQEEKKKKKKEDPFSRLYSTTTAASMNQRWLVHKRNTEERKKKIKIEKEDTKEYFSRGKQYGNYNNRTGSRFGKKKVVNDLSYDIYNDDSTTSSTSHPLTASRFGKTRKIDSIGTSTNYETMSEHRRTAARFEKTRHANETTYTPSSRNRRANTSSRNRRALFENLRNRRTKEKHHPTTGTLKVPEKKDLKSLFRRIDPHDTGLVSLVELDTAVSILYPKESNHFSVKAFHAAYENSNTTTSATNATTTTNNATANTTSTSTSTNNTEDEFVDFNEFSFFLHYLVHYRNLSTHMTLEESQTKTLKPLLLERDTSLTRQDFGKAVKDVHFLNFIQREQNNVNDLFDVIDTNDQEQIQLNDFCHYLAFSSNSKIDIMKDDKQQDDEKTKENESTTQTEKTTEGENNTDDNQGKPQTFMERMFSWNGNDNADDNGDHTTTNTTNNNDEEQQNDNIDDEKEDHDHEKVRLLPNNKKEDDLLSTFERSLDLVSISWLDVDKIVTRETPPSKRLLIQHDAETPDETATRRSSSSSSSSSDVSSTIFLVDTKSLDSDEDETSNNNNNNNNNNTVHQRYYTTFGAIPLLKNGNRDIKTTKETVAQSVFAMTNTLMGIGILSLPYAIAGVGWIAGIILLLLFTFLSWYTCRILGKLQPQTFSQLAKESFGLYGTTVLSIALYLELFISLSLFIITIGDHLYMLYPSISQSIHMTIITLFLIVVTAVLRPPRLLSYMSAIGTFASIAIVLSVLIAAIIEGDLSDKQQQNILVVDDTTTIDTAIDTTTFHSLWIPSGIPLCAGLIAFSYSGSHAIIPSFYNSMERPDENFNKVLNYSYGIVLVSYLIVAICGYYTFGDTVQDQITISLALSCSRIVQQGLTWILILTLFSKATFYVFPLSLAIEEVVVVAATHTPRSSSCSIKLLLLLLALLLAVCIPSFSILCAFVGIICTPIVSILFPVGAHHYFSTKLAH